MTGNDTTKQRIAETLEAPLASLGLDVEAVELSPAGNRRILRIAVDKDGGITLDDVADATRRIGEILDDSDVMGQQPYTLEVTSRGVDRPLTLPRHWRRNVGRLVKVTPNEGAAFTGRLTAANQADATFEVKGHTRVVALSAIEKGLVQIEFNRAAEAELGTHDDEGDDADASEMED
jgi:ribosome maturation factor RimP